MAKLGKSWKLWTINDNKQQKQLNKHKISIKHQIQQLEIQNCKLCIYWQEKKKDKSVEQVM